MTPLKKESITNRNGYIFHHITYLYHQISVTDYSFFCFHFSCTVIVKIKVIFQVCNSVCKMYTAISKKVVGKNVHATIPKGNMGYDQYTVPDTVAVEPTFVAFL